MHRLLALAPLALIAAPVIAQSSTDVVVMRRVVTAPKAPATPAQPAALIVNGSLDTLNGWTTVRGQVSSDTSKGRSGSSSARLGYPNGAILQGFNTTPGATYTASAFFSSTQGGGAGMIQLSHAGNGAEFKGNYDYIDVGGRTAWTPLTVTFRATESKTYLLIEVINHYSVNDKINVDDISVVKQ